MITATNDHLVPPQAKPQTSRDFQNSLPVLLGFEGNKFILRTVFRVFGTAFILLAPAMWILPGSLFDADLVVMKLGVSLFFLLCGMALLMRNHIDTQPEAYFDPIRRELRVLQKNDRGRPQTVLRRSYDSLGGARITSRAIELWDVDGSVLMRLPIENPDVRSALRMQLSGLVNISK